MNSSAWTRWPLLLRGMLSLEEAICRPETVNTLDVSIIRSNERMPWLIMPTAASSGIPI